MRKLKPESKEFKRVLNNLHLENISLSPNMQQRVLDTVNDGTNITPLFIKDILRDGKV